eukprot:752337-Hanusia_phi.AAC.1
MAFAADWEEEILMQICAMDSMRSYGLSGERRGSSAVGRTGGEGERGRGGAGAEDRGGAGAGAGGVGRSGVSEPEGERSRNVAVEVVHGGERERVGGEGTRRERREREEETGGAEEIAAMEDSRDRDNLTAAGSGGGSGGGAGGAEGAGGAAGGAERAGEGEEGEGGAGGGGAGALRQGRRVVHERQAVSLPHGPGRAVWLNGPHVGP